MFLCGIIVLFLFYFTFFNLHNNNNAFAEQLKLRVIYTQQANPSRKIRLDLMHLFNYRDHSSNLHSKQMIHRNIENGIMFEINVQDGERAEKYTLGFAFNIYPLSGEFEPEDDDSDEDAFDDAPYHHAETELNAFDIRVLFKVVRVDLYRPNFSKRHLIDLGSADGHGSSSSSSAATLFWNRSVIFEPNKVDTTGGNYHAFLYASLDRNQRYRHSLKSSKKLFLGYSPLLKIAANGDEHGDASASSVAQQQANSEYKVTIPIKLKRLYKHKLWNLKMYIYQFQEQKNLQTTAENHQKNPSTIVEESEKLDETNCPICLEPLKFENRQIIKLHGKGTNYQHTYHADCITRWIESKETLRCPLCLSDPKLIIVADFAPIFFNSATDYHRMYVNPTAQLFQNANSDANGIGTFAHNQALCAFNNMQQQMQHAELKIKKCLVAMDVPLLMDKLFGETFFEIGFNGFVEKQVLENVRAELESIVEQNFTQQVMDKAKAVLKVIKETREELESVATNALETVQFIREEQNDE